MGMADSGGPASVGHRGHRRVAALRRAAPDGRLVDVVSTRLLRTSRLLKQPRLARVLRDACAASAGRSGGRFELVGT